ncbi:MAG TPA: hypothetical protein VFN56_02570, partial [Candidatus Saccharimonadales bacterium]|nr:hypothetical protein [Candidatus Saccharimonadales bacterium]
CSKVNGQQVVPAGTGLSTNGLTYITQSNASLSNPSFSNGCSFYGTTTITAMKAGSTYNQNANVTFNLAPSSDGSYDASSITVSAANGVSGGTDDIVKVVTQSDIDGAKAKINTTDPSVKQSLQNQLQQDGYYAITATFNAGTPTTTTSANVGDAADNVTVTEAVTYTMLGAQVNDLKTLLANQIKSQIDTSKQSILNDGLSTANISVNNSTATTAQLNLQTTGLVGSALNVDQIKQTAAGKKSGDVQSAIKSNPGVTDVTVNLSPFWVTNVPSNTSKITVTIAKPTNTVNANNP